MPWPVAHLQVLVLALKAGRRSPTLSEPVRRVILPTVLTLACLAAPSASASSSGGAEPPSAGGGSSVGLAPPKPAPRKPMPRKPARRRKGPRKTRRGGPVLIAFDLSRRRLFDLGHPARVRFRIHSAAGQVRVRLVLRRPGSRAPVTTIALGSRATGRAQSVALTGREAGPLPQGPYVVRIAARDGRGRTLRRAKGIESTRELSYVHHRFPLAGAFSYGGSGARFGSPRSGRRHQGQDLVAASGTPIVAPRGGTIKTVAYQAGGGGHYVVLRGSGENRDYVFMHMLSGSVRVRAGQRVRTGQRIGQVGSTGSSTGPHLHFEVWVGGWFSGGKPVDPLPLLEAWDASG